MDRDRNDRSKASPSIPVRRVLRSRNPDPKAPAKGRRIPAVPVSLPDGCPASMRQPILSSAVIISVPAVATPDLTAPEVWVGLDEGLSRSASPAWPDGVG